MSATWTLHVAPFATPGDPRALDRAELVRDGFSWAAFLAPMLWFFRHRHGWLGLGALALVTGFGAALWLAGLWPGTILAAELLLHLLFGLEGSTLRRWSYARAGRPAVDAVFAASQDEAETKCFARWLADGGAPRAAPPALPRPGLVPRRGGEPIIGLFPDLEGKRP